MEELKQLLIFNKWSVEGISVNDPGLVNYINLDPQVFVSSFGRHASQRFHKSKMNIVERLINKVMIPGHKGKKHYISSGHITGKKTKAMKIVKEAFEIIEKRTGKNPIEVYVKAIENAAPREEITTIEYGGARYPKAVDCSPQRRIDLALRFFVQGAYQKAFNKKISMAESLANEIILAYQNNPQSLAISKKSELEKQADASR